MHYNLYLYNYSLSKDKTKCKTMNHIASNFKINNYGENTSKNMDL